MTTSTQSAESTATVSPRRLLTAKEVGTLLGCSWRTVYRFADSGLMPWGVKIGSLRRWDAEEIDSWRTAGCKPVRQAGGN